MKLSSYHNLKVPNFSVNLLCEILREAGLDWRAALSKADINVDAIDRLGGTIPARKELAFQMEFVAHTKDRYDLWIQAAVSYTFSAMGERGLALFSSPTIEHWTKLVCATDVGYGLHDIEPILTTDDVITGIDISFRNVPEELRQYGIYRDFCWIVHNLSTLYREPFPFIRAELPLVESSDELSEFTPCEISCGSENLRIWWDPAVSREKLPFGNSFQHETWIKAESQLIDALKASGDWVETVMKVIRDAPQYNRNLDNVAAILHITPRTLQRKIALSNTTFAQLRDQVLMETASDLLLATDYSVGRISRDLGYIDPASFTIAFKRWMGIPPTAYRNAAQYRKPITEDE